MLLGVKLLDVGLKSEFAIFIVPANGLKSVGLSAGGAGGAVVAGYGFEGCAGCGAGCAGCGAGCALMFIPPGAGIPTGFGVKVFYCYPIMAGYTAIICYYGTT